MDTYEATPATERDVEWARKFRVGVLTDMLSKNEKGRPRSRKSPEATADTGAAV